MSEFFIKNKILLIVLTAILFIGGVFAYIKLERDEDPGFKIRTASITTKCPNMRAKEVDEYVSQTIEDVILEMDEVEHIKVQSYDGLSVIFVDLYEKYKEIQPIWDKLRRKVDKIRGELPNGVSPFVNDEYGDVYGTIFSIEGDDYSYEELKDIADDVKDEILTLENAGKAEIYGAQKEAVYLTAKQSTVLNYGINQEVLKTFLKGANVLGVGGFIQVDGNKFLIEGTSSLKDVENLKNLPVEIGGGNVKLGDIFEITKGYIEPPTEICRSNGKKAILIGVSMKEGGNILNWTKEMRAEIKKLYEHYPIGLDFKIQALQGEYVKILTDKFVVSLLESIVIVIGLVLLILGIRTGIIIGFIILCIIFSTFFVMEKLGIGLDKISLSALIISLGILVDNSIVVAEGSIQRIKEGQKPEEAVIAVANKFKTALLCASLITSLAFLPIYLAKSAVSEYTSSLFKVVFITLMFSWFYSTTLLPFLTAKFIKKEKAEAAKIDVQRFFKPIVDLSLKNPFKTVGIAGGAVALSFLLFVFVPKIFFPDSDRSMFEIRLNLSESANIYQTAEKITKVENFIKTMPEIKNFSSYIGISAPRYVLSSSPVAPRENFGMILVNTEDYKTVDSCITKVKNQINKEFADVNAVVRKVPLGPPYDAPVEIRVYGFDEKEIFKFVYEIQNKLKTAEGVYLVKNDWGYKTPRIKVLVDNAQAMRLGISPYNILSSIYANFEGEKITDYFEGTTNIPVIYRTDKSFRSFTDSINSLQIQTAKGKRSVPADEVMSTKVEFEYPKIFRRDNRATVTVQAWINGNTTAHEVITGMIPFLDETDWPFGYGYEIGGSYESSKRGNKSITKEIPTAFGFILIILVVLFNGIKKPAVTAICALAALAGANIGLLITGSYFGFMTFLGYICLVGIATNNAVILLESIEGGNVKKAVRSRITPVFLTAFTTIGGMLPLWLGRDPMFSSLAIAIIFGLAGSVLITLLVAPALYLIFSRSEEVN